MAEWQKHLEIVGAELFQTYRKRLMLAGIAMEICSDYPGLSLLDVLVRVHDAGRRIMEAGDDLRALQTIRSGRWHRLRQGRARLVEVDGRRNDPSSRLLVALGGILFGGFCLGNWKRLIYRNGAG